MEVKKRMRIVGMTFTEGTSPANANAPSFATICRDRTRVGMLRLLVQRHART